MTVKDLPTYIPLAEAAEKYQINHQALTRLVERGEIQAVGVNGEIAVAEEEVEEAIQKMSKRDELWSRVQHLDGTPVSVNDAASRYRLSTGSLTQWIKAGYIRVLHRGDPKGWRGRKTLLNDADVAYAKLASEERRSRPGRSVFVPEFLPVFMTAD